MTVDYKQDRLQTLREQTEDRPAHRRYLEEIVRLHEQGKDETEWPSEESRVGVSARIQHALDSDVDAAFFNTSGFGQYREFRGKASLAARDAARTRQRQADSLESMLVIHNDKSGE